MSYFTEDYLKFFKDLAKNNNKEWFNENKKRYQSSVKEPFENFVTDLIEMVKKHNKEVDIQHKDAIFRINRDIRFSNDKTPYKLSRSAIISPKGKKDKANPGLYIESSPTHFRIYGGVYQPDKDQLLAIRDKIAQNPKALEKLSTDAKFKKVFGEIRGEQNKVLPKEFKEIAEKAPMLYNKQFYWFAELPADAVLKKDILKKIEEAYVANKKLLDYFQDAMN